MEYHQLTWGERYRIARMKSMGESLRAIARKLRRSASTISRELRRNASTSNGHYSVDKAHSYAVARRRRSRRGTHFEAQDVQLVHELMEHKWSPQQISGRLGTQGVLDVGTSTIYRWIKRDKARGGALWERTRRLSRRYRKGYRVHDRRGRLSGKRSIDERPLLVQQRLEFGHWEGDTVMGRDGRHCILTLVERKTLKVRIRKLPARRAEQVNKVLHQELGSKGDLVIKSLTLDNGTEFHGYAQLEQRHDTKFYFARPYHSWERGTNENTNGLIRQYLPKGMCFKDLTQRQCDKIEEALNNRPRKKLGFATPDEVYDEHVLRLL
jgi:IS30 family transposase